MPESKSVRLDLIANSHAFVNEAVLKALAAQDDVHQWQFAVLALVQAVELSLKAALKAIHPVLVYESIDNPKRMVTLHTAMSRLENPLVGGLAFSKRDKERLLRASKIRNEVTHSDFELRAEYAAANFFEVFGFVSDFQRRHLSCDLSRVVAPASFDSLLEIRSAIEELARRARERISDEGIDDGLVWACPNCGEDTFVLENGADACYACSFAESVVDCPQCDNPWFESEIVSFMDDIDTDYTDGEVVIYNSYGYSEFVACPDCLPGIRDAIQEERERDEIHRLEEEYYLRNA